MTPMLQEDVDRFLQELETTQDALGALFAEKGQALRDVDPERLERLADDEESLTRRMGGLLTARGRILQRAQQDGLAVDSLARLADHAPLEERRRLHERIDRLRATAEHLRRESWSQWIIANRVAAHGSQLLEYIAHHGRASPTYGRGGRDDSPGGSLLDASA